MSGVLLDQISLYQVSTVVGTHGSAGLCKEVCGNPVLIMHL